MREETNPDLPITGSAPLSVQQYFRHKCNELKKRIAEIEESNAEMELTIERKRRRVQRMRLERALLFEQIEKYDSAFKGSDQADEDSRGSPSLGPGDKDFGSNPSSAPKGQGSGSEYKGSRDSLSSPITVQGDETPQVVALDKEKEDGKISVGA